MKNKVQNEKYYLFSKTIVLFVAVAVAVVVVARTTFCHIMLKLAT